MIKKVFLTLVFSLFIIGCSKDWLTPPREQVHYIKGKLLGYDGKPMELAHVHSSIFGKQLKEFSTKVDEFGNFSLPINNPDFVELQFTGVNHQQHSLSFFTINLNQDIHLKIKLKPNIINETKHEYAVIGNFNNFSFSERFIQMSELENGTYEATLPNNSDTLYYQIINAVEDRSINGTMSQGYVYDGGGDYRSSIVTSDTSVKIIFNPHPFPVGEFNVDIKSNSLIINNYIKALKDYENIKSQAVKIYIKTKKNIDYYKALVEGINKKLENDSVNINTKLFFINKAMPYSFVEKIKDNFLKEYINSISPLSSYHIKNAYNEVKSLLSMENQLISSNYLKQILAENKNKDVKQTVLSEMIKYYHYSKGNDSLKMKYYNILINNYPNTKITKQIIKKFSPDKKIQVGKTLPKFEFKNLDDENTLINNEYLKGKFWLIDVWASWCGPCVGEMEYLHNAYKKYSGEKFSIYSISIDREKSDIDKFRKGKWKMPWLHSFSPGIWDSKVTKIFEVTGVPQPMLINPEGKIIELKSPLRGKNLNKILSKHLK